ncbi:MAG: ADP-glyceromanno-heptose 6-epimerase [bacterium]
MYVVTGGAGFIGSALVWALNERGITDIVIVDHNLDKREKGNNLLPLNYREFINKDVFIQNIRNLNLDFSPEAIFHLGACSSTTEDDMDFLRRNNVDYSLDLARYALERDIRFIYASSAATYGDGSLGYSDDHELIPELQPLNKYGRSKQLVDEKAFEEGWLDEIVGLKYFNVYGPNEYHKGEMRSVQNKSFPQAREKGTIRLFKSHRNDYEHGQQERDFLYVKDAVDMTLFFLDNPETSGIFNIGVGNARTFDDLAEAIFDALDKPTKIEYFAMPEEIRPNYQYHTEADLTEIRNAGYTEDLYSLEEGIKDYVQNYLLNNSAHLTPS